jgi:hypothetical protein
LSSSMMPQLMKKANRANVVMANVNFIRPNTINSFVPCKPDSSVPGPAGIIRVHPPAATVKIAP